MTIYKAVTIDAQEGTVIAWTTSKADACRRIQQWQREGMSTTVAAIYRKTVKPTREGIVAFLNTHTPARDNG